MNDATPTPASASHGTLYAHLAPELARRNIILDGEQEAHLIALACSQPPAGRRRWTVRLLATRFVELGSIDRVAPEAVRQALKKTN